MAYQVTYSDTLHKNYIKDRIFGEVVKRRVTQKLISQVLTLTNIDYDLEERILQDGSRITIVERDLDVYRQQVNDLEGRYTHLRLVHSSISDFVREDKMHYNVAFLDFCGPFCAEVHKTLIDIHAKRIYITLLAARENYQSHLYAKQPREDVHALFFDSCGYKIIDTIHYSTKSPMVVYVLDNIPVFKEFKDIKMSIEDRIKTMPIEFDRKTAVKIHKQITPAGINTFLARAKQKGYISVTKRGLYKRLI